MLTLERVELRFATELHAASKRPTSLTVTPLVQRRLMNTMPPRDPDDDDDEDEEDDKDGEQDDGPAVIREPDNDE